VRPADGIYDRRAGLGEQLGQLTASAAVQRLEQPPMGARRQAQLVVIGQTLGPAGPEHAHRQVLVNDDHRNRLGSVLDFGAAADERIPIRHGVQSGLELAGQIPIDQSAQELPVGLGQTRVTSPPPPAAFFKQFLTDTHVTSLPPAL
jgi:hypothetical protein